MRKISHRKQKAEPVCTGLPDDSEKESPVWVFIDREQKRGVSFPCGEGIPPDQLPSRLGDCLRNRHEPTSLRTGRALTGTARRNCGRQGDDTPKGRLVSALLQYRSRPHRRGAAAASSLCVPNWDAFSSTGF